MSGLKPKFSSEDQPRNPGCLVTQDVPAVCLRLQSHRQQLALPYALLLRVELSEDETGCALTFATHEVRIHGRRLRAVYVAVSQGQAVQIGIGESADVREGDAVIGPLVTALLIDPIEEVARTRR